MKKDTFQKTDPPGREASGASQPAGGTFNEWALVELMGHARIIGRCSEAVIAGGAMLRVDVPSGEGLPPFTRFYGAAAIYAISPISEELARALAKKQSAEPVSRFDLPALAEKCEPASDP